MADPIVIDVPLRSTLVVLGEVFDERLKRNETCVSCEKQTPYRAGELRYPLCLRCRRVAQRELETI